MRVLYSHYLHDEGHAAVRMTHAIAGELRLRGHEVLVHRSVGAPTPPGSARPRSTGLRGLLNRGTYAFKTALSNRVMYRRDIEAVRAFRPDVVLARHDAYCLSMPLACGGEGVPLVTYADAPSAHEARTFNLDRLWHPPVLAEAMEREVLRRSRAVITVSNPSARLLGRHLLTTPVEVIPNGVDPARFHAPADREAAKRALGLGGRCVVGFVGTFRPFHGLDMLRELMTRFTSDPEIAWLLVGDGPGREALQKEAGGRNGVVLTGRQPQSRVAELLAGVDVALNPYPDLGRDFYFCPLKILEAAAAGCAVVASIQGDIPRLLDGGRAGVLLPPADVDAWASALRSLAASPARRAELGRRAREHVLSHLTWADTARAVERVLLGAARPKGFSGWEGAAVAASS